ncbi:IS630 family transposase [Ktedonobacter racemifer]|uniref:Transposase n=1 Tax=Ktedonobacter racemifer DSM 44963 TaxID=485913 RepID=D6U792_KTERA|nr:IS630 family transposase [Ktedonobacter racemifer]EFH79753.1 transposase [Ktedonobacter racemifer DSM 44963]
MLQAIDAGQSQTGVAKAFSISVATIKRYLKQRREMGHVLPKSDPRTTCGQRSSVAGSSASATGSPSRRNAGRALPPVPPNSRHPGQPGEHQSRAHGIGLDTKKKTLRASEQDEAARAAWREQAKQLPTQDLVIVDETGSRINMTPLYAYAPRGERAIGTVPRNYGANLTLIASLSLQGMGEAMLLDGSADAAAFETYVEQILAPSLRPGQIMILDNLSIHLGPRVKQAIEGRGCQLLFLPAYSPDFSPIEGAFSKLKAFLRRVGARSREALQDAIIQALPYITPQDALGWFRHCDYPAPSIGRTTPQG